MSVDDQGTKIRGAPWCGRVPRRWQVDAVRSVEAEMVRGLSALVSAVTGSGKTLALAELAAREAGTVLVTTPSQHLVGQLADVLEERCPGKVGRYFQHERTTDRRITVACTASLARLVEERPEGWALWLVDEAHTMEGDGLRDVRDLVRRERMAGFTATPFRADRKGLLGWALAFTHGLGEAQDDGTVVPYRVVRWEGEGDPDVDRLTAEWLDAAQGPGLITARNIADAEACAAEHGILALHSRLTTAERERRLEMLRTGEVEALVHVNLVTEGVDLPWLQWLILRAPTKSRRRLAQQVGRIFRVFEGKAEAVVYDPHDVMRTVRILHAEVLDDEPEPEVTPRPRIEALGDHETAGMPEPVAVTWWEGWTADVLARMVARGIVPPGAVLDRGRGTRASEALTAKLTALLPAAALLPADLRPGPSWFAGRELSQGTTADLVLVLAMVKRHGGCPVEVGRG